MEYFFSEKQKFNQWWLWLTLAGINAFMLTMLLQIPTTHPSYLGLWIGLIISLFITIIFYFFTLETRIHERGIEVRFFPFHTSFITIFWGQLKKAEIRQYNALKEYGGWGLRYGSCGKAYNISGNTGIHLVFQDGSSLLIGTQKAEEAKAALSLKNIPSEITNRK